MPATTGYTVERMARNSRSLAELRKELGVTQIDLAELLGIQQTNVSQLESRGDAKVSTLRSYVEALGGRLELVAVIGKERIPLELLTDED